jgi:hypothetical protein
MSVICEIFQSHELKWQVKDCEPKWNQNDQKTVLHSMTLYPDLDYTKADGTSTYVKYTSAEKIRELLLEIHKHVCEKVNDKKAESSAKNEALELPAGGSNLPAVQGSRELATTQKPGLPVPYNAAQYTKPEEPGQKLLTGPEPQKLLTGPEDQKKLPAPAITKWYCLTFEDESKSIHSIELKDGEQVPVATTLVGTEIEEKGKVKLASGPYETEEEATKNCAVEEKSDEDCCNYYVTIKTTKLRMIEEGKGTKSFSFRYLMSNNMLKDLGDEKISNADKFTITITPASNGLSKVFGASYDMKLEDFNSDNPSYPGNLIVAVIPTLELNLAGNETMPEKDEPKAYSEISAKQLKAQINAFEFDERNANLTPEEKEVQFKALISKWEEAERRDVS